MENTIDKLEAFNVFKNILGELFEADRINAKLYKACQDAFCDGIGLPKNSIERLKLQLLQEK